MPPGEFGEIAERVANDLLVWVGFGTLVGLFAKAIMPGKDPGGAIATLLMGIGGTVFGCGTLMFFWPEQRITPISPIGFLAATGGAFMLLLFHRLLAGRIVSEGDDISLMERFRRLKPRARKTIVIDD